MTALRSAWRDADYVGSFPAMRRVVSGSSRFLAYTVRDCSGEQPLVVKTGPHDMKFSGRVGLSRQQRIQCTMHITFLKLCKGLTLVNAVDHSLQNSPSSIFGVCNRVTDGPLVSEYLVIVTALRFDK